MWQDLQESRETGHLHSFSGEQMKAVQRPQFLVTVNKILILCNLEQVNEINFTLCTVNNFVFILFLRKLCIYTFPKEGNLYKKYRAFKIGIKHCSAYLKRHKLSNFCCHLRYRDFNTPLERKAQGVVLILKHTMPSYELKFYLTL